MSVRYLVVERYSLFWEALGDIAFCDSAELKLVNRVGIVSVTDKYISPTVILNLIMEVLL